MFSRINGINISQKEIIIPSSIPLQITPSYAESSIIDIVGFPYLGVLTITTTGTAYNVTPNVSFTANVQIWGAGGGSNPSIGGGGGFTTGIVKFEAGVSYNVVVGTAGSSGTGGGGSGIEYLANSNPILIAGGGGGGGSGVGGAGGGLFAANGTGTGATSYAAASPGVYRTGGPAASVFGMGYGGSGTGGGGGGMYGGAGNGAGGGGGSGWISPGPTVVTGNTITGSGSSAANPSADARIAAGPNYGNGANNGLIVITVLNT
jgi:hypothetical protein